MIILVALLIVGGVVYWLVNRGRTHRGGSSAAGQPAAGTGVARPEAGLPAPPPRAPGRIEVSGLTKRYGAVTAVEDLSFAVEPGRVTGFLGPNGPGKAATLRVLLGLAEPTAGTATIGDARYGELDRPTRRVGAVLEGSAAHRGRTGRNHLRVICRAAGVPLQRADEVLAMVGLAADGGRAA